MEERHNDAKNAQNTEVVLVDTTDTTCQGFWASKLIRAILGAGLVVSTQIEQDFDRKPTENTNVLKYNLQCCYNVLTLLQLCRNGDKYIK